MICAPVAYCALYQRQWEDKYVSGEIDQWLRCNGLTKQEFQALVADYLDSGRVQELRDVERRAKKGMLSKDGTQVMIAFAKAHVAHPDFRRRTGLSFPISGASR